MDFTWNDTQQNLYRDIVNFARKKLNENLQERESRGEFYRQGWKNCAEYGIHGLFAPEAYGGSELDSLSTAYAIEVLGYGCRDMGLVFSIAAHMFACLEPILQYGTEQQKQKYLSNLISGKWIAANGMSEPGSGSDAFALSTTATRDGDDFVLNGSKCFVTNGPIADIFVVYATTDKKKGILGLQGFILEKDFPGIECSTSYEKIGLTTSPIGDLFLDNCRVPVENRLGSFAQGAKIFSDSMEWERTCLFAAYLGFMQRQLEETIHHAKQREQFGKSISKFQGVSHKIVDMKIRLDASKLLLYRSASQIGSRRNAMSAAIAKVFVSESAVKSSLDAIQMHGAYGIMKESGIERYLRDAVPSTLFSGTSEIQRNIIAKNLKL